MSEKRVLLITGTTDMLRVENETDNLMEEVFELTLPSKIRYVKKHKYDLMSLRSFGVDNQNRFGPRDIGFLRALRSFEMLEYYDTVMWIDADSIITNENYSIENFGLNEEISFCASFDWPGRYTFSTGNFIVNRSKSINEFFNLFLEICKSSTSEQQAFNTMFRSTPMRNTMNILEYNFLGGVPRVMQTYPVWQNRSRIEADWNEDYFLAHLTGVSNKDRIDILTKHLSKYL